MFRKKKISINPDQLGLFDLRPKISPGRGALAVPAEATQSKLAPLPVALPVGADRSGKVWRRLESGYYGWDVPASEPISFFTRGCFSAIEASRVMRGLSVEIAGLLKQSVDEVMCWHCLRYLCGGDYYVKLFKPEREGKALPGEAFTCYKCRTNFEAHRDEFH